MVLSNTSLRDFMSRREFLEDVLTHVRELGGEVSLVNVERVDRLYSQHFTVEQAARCEVVVQQRAA